MTDLNTRKLDWRQRKYLQVSYKSVTAIDLPKIRLWDSIFFYTACLFPNPRSGETDGKTIALCYRGSTYERELPTPAVETEGETVILIYQGHTYKRKLQSPQAYQKPCEINWRWQ